MLTCKYRNIFLNLNVQIWIIQVGFHEMNHIVRRRSQLFLRKLGNRLPLASTPLSVWIHRNFSRDNELDYVTDLTPKQIDSDQETLASWFAKTNSKIFFNNFIKFQVLWNCLISGTVCKFTPAAAGRMVLSDIWRSNQISPFLLYDAYCFQGKWPRIMFSLIPTWNNAS